MLMVATKTALGPPGHPLNFREGQYLDVGGGKRESANVDNLARLEIARQLVDDEAAEVATLIRREKITPVVVTETPDADEYLALWDQRDKALAEDRTVQEMVVKLMQEVADLRGQLAKK